LWEGRNKGVGNFEHVSHSFIAILLKSEQKIKGLMDEHYLSQTFRVFKKNEIDEYGEYRTRRLVLEAWDREWKKI